MNEILSQERLQWLREHLVLGDRHVFADMEKTTERIKKETENSKPIVSILGCLIFGYIANGLIDLEIHMLVHQGVLPWVG